HRERTALGAEIDRGGIDRAVRLHAVLVHQPVAIVVDAVADLGGRGSRHAGLGHSVDAAIHRAPAGSQAARRLAGRMDASGGRIAEIRGADVPVVAGDVGVHAAGPAAGVGGAGVSVIAIRGLPPADAAAAHVSRRARKSVVAGVGVVDVSADPDARIAGVGGTDIAVVAFERSDAVL